jgi:hypothetical protein
MPRRQIAGLDRYIEVANEYFESVTKLGYLGRTINENRIHEEIEIISNPAIYHAVRIISSSRLLTKTTKIKTYKIIILLTVCVGVKICSAKLRAMMEGV